MPKTAATRRRADASDSAPGALWSRNFLLFFTARAVAKLGDMMLPVALAAGLVAHGYGASAVGGALAAFTACFAGFVIFGGVIADRFNPQRLMIGADVVRIGTQSLMAVMFFTGRVALWEVCAIGAVNGIAAAVFQPGVATTIPRIAADVQGANGSIRVAEATMTLAGPVLAGMLVGFASVGTVFVAHAGTYLASAVCLLLLRLGPMLREQPAQPSTFRADLVEGWREFRSRTWMWGVIVIWCSHMLLAWGPTIPLVATDVVQEHGAGAYGLINSALGAGMIVGGLLGMRLRPRHPLRAGGFAIAGMALQALAVGLGMPVPWIAAAMVVTGAGNAFWGVMWTTSVLTQVPAPVLSRIHAYEVAGSVAMLPVGQALAGPAAGLFGVREVLLANAVMAVVTSVALVSVRAIRNLERVPQSAG
ncbi:MFS transporter [Streptomyces boninensis]|uniref:MFS transporter n=1 Tax=Streptomyces boninensis TaxID=2039455 RepID=UPI003B20CE14